MATKIYVVHYKPGTKMFNPTDKPESPHVHFTRYPDLTKQYLDSNKSVERWYWVE